MASTVAQVVHSLPGKLAQCAAILLSAKAWLVLTINTFFFSLFVSLTPFAAELKCS